MWTMGSSKQSTFLFLVDRFCDKQVTQFPLRMLNAPPADQPMKLADEPCLAPTEEYCTTSIRLGGGVVLTDQLDLKNIPVT